MEITDRILKEKYDKLKDDLAAMGSAAAAFSGGVDSTFLLFAAKEALGDNVIAVTAASYLFPARELGEAKAFCAELGIKQIIVPARELEIEGFAQNPVNRCYLCKKDLFGKIKKTAEEQGMNAVAEGSNLDDTGDYRPGLAAIDELGIRSPLRETGFTKAEIRALSAVLGLPAKDKPSFACLASRFPYGETISEEKLGMVDRAEQYLLELGFRQFRVRIHGGNLARIELLPEEFDRFMRDEVRVPVCERLRELGFAYVSLDLQGYRTGSLNETIAEEG